MKIKRIVFAAALALVAGAMVLWAQDDPASNAGVFDYSDAATVVLGRDLYATNCASCHGANLEGQDDWQSPNANGRAPAPPHDKTGHTWHHPDAQLFQIVKHGTAAIVGNGYESDMAGYAGVLGDDEISAVMAFVKSTWPADIIERHNAMNAASQP